MKHLLNGVAIAAALVIAAPVWAQAPTTGAAPAAPKAAAPAAPMTGMASPQRHKRVRHMARHGSGGSQADQLNGQELARIQGGGTAPPATPPVSSESPYGKAGQQK
jgi:hypothetical protein